MPSTLVALRLVLKREDHACLTWEFYLSINWLLPVLPITTRIRDLEFECYLPGQRKPPLLGEKLQ